MSNEIYFGAETENKHFDVGIVGWWYNDNYGGTLTYYALNRLVQSMGYSVLMIERPSSDPNYKPNYSTIPRRFAKKYYNISKNYHPNKMGILNGICDTFISGSDQLFSSYLWKYSGPSYYLDFTAPDKNIISYASSFGNSFDGSIKYRMMISYYLRRFNALSVREDYAVDIVRDNFGLEAKKVLDPVFVCDAAEYHKIADNSAIKLNEKYFVNFILDPDENKRNAILYAKEKLNLPFVNLIHALNFEENTKKLNLDNIKAKADVEDFLNYYRNAEFIITDSFHGTCFAIIFRKPFISIANKRRGTGRFISLLNELGLQNRMVNDASEILNRPELLEKIDYTETEKRLSVLRDDSYNWLKSALAKPVSRAKNDFQIMDNRQNILANKLNKLSEQLNELKKSLFNHSNTPSNSNNIQIAQDVPQRENNNRNSITDLLNMSLCTGCGACVSACPKDALSLQQDNWGYYRSALNAELCINCGLCSKICPALNLPQKTNKKEPPLYAFIAADKKILESSSSGGIFSLLANEAFKRGGCVAGAAWTDDLHVKHILIENKEELHKLQKSKYLQSYLGDFDRKIKEKLDAGRFVLFSGCPCQVTGLKAYLGKDYDNLITVDLLCGNSPSSEFFQKYLKDSFPKGVKDYQFRYKKQGWNADCLTLTLTDGTKIERRGGGQDDYQKLYHPHVMCPSHCEQCKYQALPRYGDITIGDFWGYSKHDNSVDTSEGISAVFCNNEKGQAFFDAIPDEAIKVKKTVPLEWIGRNGYAYAGHGFCSPNRDKFYKAIQTMPFSEAIKTALTPNRLSSYPDPLSLQPLHYDTSQLRFRFDANMWEEHFANGVTILTTKVTDPPLGNYAVMPLMHPLVKGKKYRLSVRFKVKTKSKEFSFHIKESDSKKIQVVYVHTVKPENSAQWVNLKTDFIPGGNMYDEFMIGSAHIRGEERFFAVDYIDISEVETANQELKNQLTWMTNAANFFESLSKDYFSDHKFDSFIKDMSGKKIAVLKTQDRAGHILLKAAEAYGVQVVFSSSKAYLKQLTDEEWQMCKTADTIVCCCVHGTVPDEREGIKAISILSLLQ